MARFTLNWGAIDITKDVMSYKRTSAICEGTKSISIEMIDNSRGIGTWDVLTLWEDGNKVGKFFVLDIKETHVGSLSVSGQDSSLKLARNFEERTWSPGYVSTSKYWICLWLDRAGVSYNFTVSGNGATLNKNLTFGMDTTWNLIVPLLQQSGWYMIFDSEDVLQIGELDVDTSSVSESMDETDIIAIAYTKNDSTARNRVVVWGGMDISTDTWITGVAESGADWQIDSNDDRSVVVSSNSIRNYYSAYSIANRLLNESISMSKEKILTVTGYRNRVVGDYISVSSRVYSGTGLITDLTVSADKVGGYSTEITLDRRCPRLFAYFSYSGYVYAGTVGGGVYRKLLEGSIWSTYNSGLTDLDIKDLYIKNGVFVCVTGDGYAYKSTIATGYWTKLSHGKLTDNLDNEYEETDVVAKACTIDNDGTVIVGYTHPTLELSWMVHFNPSSGITRTAQLIVDGETELPIFDLDNNGEITLIGTEGQGLIDVKELYVDGLNICRNVWTEYSTATFDRRPVAKASVNNYNTTVAMDAEVTKINSSVVFNENYDYFASSGSTHRFSGCTREDYPATVEVDLPVDDDCYYATVSLIDEDTVIEALYEENYGYKIFSVNFATETATLLKGIEMSSGNPPIQTHAFSNGTVHVIISTLTGNTIFSVCSAGGATDFAEVFSISFNDDTNSLGGRVTPYELSGGRYALISGGGGGETVGVIVSSSGTISDEEEYEWNLASRPYYNPPPALEYESGPTWQQFCPNGTYSAIYCLSKEYRFDDIYWNVLKFDGEFSVAYRAAITNYNDVAKLSSWRGGTYLLIYDTVAETVSTTLLEGGGYTLPNTLLQDDRISPRSDDYDGAFIVYARGEHELRRYRGSSYTVLDDALTDTGYIWLAGGSVITEAERIYTLVTGSFLIQGSTGTIIRDSYSTAPITTSGTMATILEDIQGSPVIEISRTAPAIVHTGPSSSSYLYSLTNIKDAVDIDDWNALGTAHRIPMKQGRTYFKEEADGSFTNFHFAATTDDLDIRSFNVNLESEGEIVFSGAIVSSGTQLHRLETSNGVDPYFFASTSGAPSQFFQKNTGSSTFTEQSTGLPNNNIRIIRLDDRIA